MFGIGSTELIVVLFIILLLFGGRKLPELARSMGGAVKEYQQATREGVKKEEVAEKKENDERAAILEAAKKLGIETEGRSISEIAEELVKVAGKKV